MADFKHVKAVVGVVNTIDNINSLIRAGTYAYENVRQGYSIANRLVGEYGFRARRALLRPYNPNNPYHPRSSPTAWSSGTNHFVTTRALTSSSMPYSKRHYKKRKRNGGGSAMSVAKKALSKVRKMESKRDVKTFDINLSTLTLVGTGGVITNMGQVAQGDGRTQRDGNIIFPFFMDIRLTWRGVAASITDVYRTIIFRDKRQVESTTPLVTHVLIDAHPLSQLAAAARSRWKILFA